MIKALIEQGIPIDRVAGVSIGALVGAVWCYNRNTEIVDAIVKNFLDRMTTPFLYIRSFTLPVVAYTSGHVFNEEVRFFVGDHDMADAWIPLVVVTTDVSDMLIRVHDIESLWVYVRGSMTLVKYLPAICDPRDGHLLVDGGYCNNLPANLMKKRGFTRIIAADVSAEDSKSFTNYGLTLSGFWYSLSKWLPWIDTIEIPDMNMRLPYTGQIIADNENPRSSFSKIFRPPVSGFDTLEFGKCEEIKEIGYNYAKSRIAELRKEGHFADCEPLQQIPVVQQSQ